MFIVHKPIGTRTSLVLLHLYLVCSEIPQNNLHCRFQRKVCTTVHPTGYSTIPSSFIFECLLYNKKFLKDYSSYQQIHSHNTRNRQNFIQNFHRIAKTRDGLEYYGPKLFNVIIKVLEYKVFRKKLKSFLLRNAFYCIEQFLMYDFNYFLWID